MSLENLEEEVEIGVKAEVEKLILASPNPRESERMFRSWGWSRRAAKQAAAVVLEWAREARVELEIEEKKDAILGQLLIQRALKILRR